MWGSARGFTLVELLVTLVLAGILAATALARWGSIGANTVSYQADEFARNLRHTQMLALTWGQTLRLNVVSAVQYNVRCVDVTAPTPCNGANAITDPATGAPFVVDLDNVTLAGASVDFDSLGRPLAGGVLIGANPARSYSLTGGAHTSSVTLRPLTGFVEVVH